MIPLALAFCIVSADPSAEQLDLLTTFRDEFVAITPGKGKFPKSFTMGRDAGPKSQRPTHKVTFDYSFEVAKYEVPQNLWQAVMGHNPSRWKGPRNSVEMLTHADAKKFCLKVTQLMRDAKLIKPGEIVRLPSEAEWEYFTRAGTETLYSFGDDPTKLGEYGWYAGNAAGNDPPVGAKKPNPWGLFDVHGYLLEFCLDQWQDNYDGVPKDGHPNRKGDGKSYVVRGGGWTDKAPMLTSSYRVGVSKDFKHAAVGLRCVLTKK